MKYAIFACLTLSVASLALAMDLTGPKPPADSTEETTDVVSAGEADGEILKNCEGQANGSACQLGAGIGVCKSSACVSAN